MSEELREKAREFLREHAPEYKYQCVLLHGVSVELSLALAEFASQVCEQREKEHALDFGELSPEEFNAAQPAYLANFDNHDKQRALTFAGMLVSFRTQPLIERAEAAELALQTLKLAFATNEAALQESQRELAELKRGLRNNNTDFELAFLDAYLDQFRTLRATLQAKERELAESRLNHIDANDRNIKAEDTAAQARQQAIAECAEVAEEMGGVGGLTDELSTAIARAIRSLTPPTSKTKDEHTVDLLSNHDIR